MQRGGMRGSKIGAGRVAAPVASTRVSRAVERLDRRFLPPL
jgi:hypothetical protein